MNLEFWSIIINVVVALVFVMLFISVVVKLLEIGDKLKEYDRLKTKIEISEIALTCALTELEELGSTNESVIKVINRILYGKDGENKNRKRE